MFGLIVGTIMSLIGFADQIENVKQPSSTTRTPTSYNEDDIVDVEYEEVN